MATIIIGWSLIGIIIVLYFVLAFFTNILRDPHVHTDAVTEAAKGTAFEGKPVKEMPQPFSLARTQLATWTALIACCYLFLALVYSPAPGKKVVDTALTINTTVLILMGISMGSSTFATIIDSSQSENVRHQDEPSRGFFRDILSDKNGISIHRFQNVVWTIVCMAVFGYKFWTTKSLPTLDPTLIALTGISSATYLTLKVGENNTKAAPANPPANP